MLFTNQHLERHSLYKFLINFCIHFCNLVDCNCLNPLSVEFSRQEYWGGSPFPSPRDLPDSGVEPGLLLWQAQMVKSLPAIQETPVQSLDWEDPLEEEMATHSIILAWRTPQTEEPGVL